MTTTTMTADGFTVEVTPTNPGPNAIQRLGARLWAPMWLMAVGGFAAGIVTAGIRANAIASGEAASTIQAQGHLVTGFMFIGFAAVFAAISFAIARILGVFRDGGGRVQETTGADVQTLAMAPTARAFVVLMTTAMMALVVSVIVHFALAASTAAGTVGVADSETAAIVLEGVRRFSVALYLVAIALGLASITKVLRFQAVRLRMLPGHISHS